MFSVGTFSTDYVIIDSCGHASGILKAKKKLGVTFNSDQQKVIDLMKLSKIVQGIWRKFMKVVIDAFFGERKW